MVLEYSHSSLYKLRSVCTVNIIWPLQKGSCRNRKQKLQYFTQNNSNTLIRLYLLAVLYIMEYDLFICDLEKNVLFTFSEMLPFLFH